MGRASRVPPSGFEKAVEFCIGARLSVWDSPAIPLGIICGILLWAAVFASTPESLDEAVKETDSELKDFLALLFFTGPIGVLVYWPLRGLIWSIKKIPRFVILLARCAKEVFTLIHSELRILCGIDATIGAIVGYIIGNAIIGAFVGGLFGLLNYQIISVRILKIQPARARG